MRALPSLMLLASSTVSCVLMSGCEESKPPEGSQATVTDTMKAEAEASSKFLADQKKKPAEKPQIPAGGIGTLESSKR